jgi:hypothetical protein
VGRRPIPGTSDLSKLSLIPSRSNRSGLDQGPIGASSEGVKAVTPQIKSNLNREKSIMDKIDAVIEQIDAMRGGK